MPTGASPAIWSSRAVPCEPDLGRNHGPAWFASWRHCWIAGKRSPPGAWRWEHHNGDVVDENVDLVCCASGVLRRHFRSRASEHRFRPPRISQVPSRFLFQRAPSCSCSRSRSRIGILVARCRAFESAIARRECSSVTTGGDSRGSLTNSIGCAISRRARTNSGQCFSSLADPGPGCGPCVWICYPRSVPISRHLRSHVAIVTPDATSRARGVSQIFPNPNSSTIPLPGCCLSAGVVVFPNSSTNPLPGCCLCAGVVVIPTCASPCRQGRELRFFQALHHQSCRGRHRWSGFGIPRFAGTCHVFQAGVAALWQAAEAAELLSAPHG